jgi:hypothetical protein
VRTVRAISALETCRSSKSSNLLYFVEYLIAAFILLAKRMAPISLLEQKVRNAKKHECQVRFRPHVISVSILPNAAGTCTIRVMGMTPRDFRDKNAYNQS